MHADIQDLVDQLDRNDRDAAALIKGLTPEQGVWQRQPGSWSVSECLDHLAVGNRVYVAAMEPAAARARERGRMRCGPAKPGLLGGLFVRSLEPPVKPVRKLRAPKKIKPRAAPALADSFAAFIASQDDVRRFLRDSADLDLNRINFPNPFVPGLRWSLATGFNALTAHARRHLWQANNVRKALRSTHG
jgi:hypothetical protein